MLKRWTGAAVAVCLGVTATLPDRASAADLVAVLEAEIVTLELKQVV